MMDVTEHVTAEEILDEIGEDFLTCAICFEEFSNPKILQCYHTFCEHCLQTLVQKNRGKLKCPTCRQEYQLPKDGVSGLENNFYLNSLLSTVQKRQKQSSKSQPRQCETCDEQDASHVCIDCGLQYYCDTCANIHRRSRISATHSVLSVQEYKQARRQNPSTVLPVSFCPNHVTNTTKFYCDTCQIPICSDCTIIDHPKGPDHAHRYLDKVAKEYIKLLSQMVDKLESKAREVEDKRESATEACNQLKETCKTESGKVVEKTEKSFQFIEQEGDRLVAEIESDYIRSTCSQQSCIEDLKMKYGKLACMISYIAMLVRHTNAAHILLTRENINKCIDELLAIDNKANILQQVREFRPTKRICQSKVLGVLIHGKSPQNISDRFQILQVGQNEPKFHMSKAKVSLKKEMMTRLQNARALDRGKDAIVGILGDDFLTCSICFNQYNEPKILPCHHVFCKNCLEMLVTDEYRSLQCPTCQKQCNLTDGVERLEGNIFLDSQLFGGKDSNDGSLGYRGKCEVCDDNDASHVCIDCQLQYYCDSCRKVHSRSRISASHNIITIDDYKKARRNDPSTVLPVSYCPNHKANPMRFYCDTCQKPICSDCTIIDHPKGPDHVHRYLDKVVEDYTKQLSKTVETLEMKAEDIYQSRLRATKDCVEVEKWGEREKDKVIQKIEDVRQSLSDNSNGLIAEISEYYDQEIGHYHAYIDDLQLLYGRIVSMCNYIEMLKRHKNATHLLSNRGNTNQRAKDLIAFEINPIAQQTLLHFQPACDVSAGHMLGTLASDEDVYRCSLENCPTKVVRGSTNQLQVAMLNKGGNRVVSAKPVKAFLSTPDGSQEDIEVFDNHDGTYVLKVHGKMIGDNYVTVTVGDNVIQGSELPLTVLAPVTRSVGSYGFDDGFFSSPAGLAITKEGNIVIADIGNRRMQIVSQDGSCKKVLKFKFSNAFLPWDVKISSDGYYFVTDRGNKQIVVIDNDGNLLKCFGHTELKNPFGVCISPLGDVYVTDWDGLASDTNRAGHSIKKYTQDGEFIKAFGKFGTDSGNFQGPYFMDFDSEGHLFVSELNNSRIQVFDGDDNFIYSFGNYGKDGRKIIHPTGIVISRDDYIYVCDRINGVLTFTTKGQFISRINSEADDFDNLRGIAIIEETSTKILVVDSQQHCVTVFDM